MNTPDAHGRGLTEVSLDPLRYDGHTDDPDEVAGLLRSYVGRDVRVLDVGCGTGSVSVIVNRNSGNEVHGIEPDEQRAAVARSRGLNVYCGFLTEEYFAEHGTFDVIMFADVIEHLADPVAMLRLADIGLRPDGFLLISVPNVAHWTMRLDLMRGRFDYADCGIRDATHLRWFTKKTLEQMLHAEGFEIERIQHSAGVMLYDYAARKPWKWLPRDRRNQLVRALNRRMPLLFGCQHVVKARRKAVH